jgi:hypothetical protein
VRNNPLKYVDPSGHCAQDPSKGDDWCRQGAMDFDALAFIAEEINKNYEGLGAEFAREFDTYNFDDFEIDGASFGLGSATFSKLLLAGEPWDYKFHIFLLADAVGSSYKRRDNIDSHFLIRIGKKQYDADDLGNLHFGFIGRRIGYKREVLLGAAGLIQIKYAHDHKLPFPKRHVEYGGEGLWSVFAKYDEPQDRAAIMAGMYLWDKYGQYGMKITRSHILEALDASPNVWVKDVR